MELEKPPVEVLFPMRMEVLAKVEKSLYAAVLLTESVRPELRPMKMEFAALMARVPALVPKKLEWEAFVADCPALVPKKLDWEALVAPFPAPFPKKLDWEALVALDPA